MTKDTTKMTVERKRFLNERLREHAKQQPEIRELKRILLKLGGCHLVAPLEGPEDILGALIQSGHVMLRLATIFGPLRQFNLAHPLGLGLRSGFCF
jgi:hypothetical protein